MDTSTREINEYRRVANDIAQNARAILGLRCTILVKFGCHWGRDFNFCHAAHVHWSGKKRGRICLNGRIVFEEYPLVGVGASGEDVFDLIAHECTHLLGRGWVAHTEKFNAFSAALAYRLRRNNNL